MQSYDASLFESKVEEALLRVRTLLENTRNPQYAAEVSHRYEDKYHLAEFLTRIAIASLHHCLAGVGLQGERLSQARDWARARSVTVRLRAEEKCEFLREATRRIEPVVQRETEIRSSGGQKTTITDKLVANVTEYFWRVSFHWELVAFQGASDAEAIPLASRSGTVEVKTGAKTTPQPSRTVMPPIDVNVTWLLAHGGPTFSIDRTRASCHTPRRNEDIDAALSALSELHAFSTRVAAYFTGSLFPIQKIYGLDLSALGDDGVFVPVVPLFEDGTPPPEQQPPALYAEALLAEEARSLAAKQQDTERVFPRDQGAISVAEADLVVTLAHARAVCERYAGGLQDIERMLRVQLISAIGKVVTPDDFTRYMDFHQRKLIIPEARPRPFSYAIRRPDHDPEGTLALEAGSGSSMTDPIATTVASSAAPRPMSFALDASTRVSFLGDRHLHATIAHQFSDSPAPTLQLVARARQFSSFILLVGRITSADTFDPRYAMVIQNRDLLKLPLILETIPSAQEFRDAIASLSPEQQRFAKAFRGMQLESTLFGVCVIQIKPQLEKLLKLPPDSLTKEIKLTQDLLGLFSDYQIPSDLLSYDGPADAAAEDKLARVKTYVGRMQEVIDQARKREIEEAREREALRLAELDRSPMAGGPPPFAVPMAAQAVRGLGGPPRGFPPPPSPAAFGGPPQVASAVAPAARAAAYEGGPAPTPPTSPTAGPPPVRGDGGAGDALDYTRIPAELDRRLEALDKDGALRPTILKPGDVWTRTAHRGLLDAAKTTILAANEQKTEKNRAFDLLDALTKSGALTVEDASLHVVIAATHCFDKTLLDAVIQDNVNPIEKVERSLMIVASTIHRRPVVELLAGEQKGRFLSYAPDLATDAPGGELPAS